MNSLPCRKVVVEGVSPNTSPKFIKEILEAYGKIEDFHMPQGKRGTMHRGFGFATYARSKHAQRAMSEIHGARVNGSVLSCKPYTDKKKEPEVIHLRSSLRRSADSVLEEDHEQE